MKWEGRKYENDNYNNTCSHAEKQFFLTPFHFLLLSITNSFLGLFTQREHTTFEVLINRETDHSRSKVFTHFSKLLWIFVERHRLHDCTLFLFIRLYYVLLILLLPLFIFFGNAHFFKSMTTTNVKTFL